MGLTYARDRYKKLSEDVLEGNIDINNKENRAYLYKELETLGESNVEDRIKKISKYNRNKSEKSNLVKDIFREVNGENKPELKIQIKNTTSQEEIKERNERNISTDKTYKECGCISIYVKNYNRNYKEEDISKFIKVKGKNINFEIKNPEFNEGDLNLELEYTIEFKKKTRPGEYKETIEITFRDVESKIYEFFISCREEHNKTYNFKFKSISGLYNIFKDDVEKYNKGETDYTSTIDIFKDKDFSDYLSYIKEYAALDLYKNLNLISYKLEDLNLFFTTLGYEQCYIKKFTKEIVPKENKIVKQIEEDIELRFFKLYYIDNIENNLKIKVFSNKNNDIEVKRAIEIIPSKMQKLLKMILKEKMDKFNSCIFIKDTNILKHIFTYYIKRESIKKSFMILISSEKSNNELNLYSLKVHM